MRVSASQNRGCRSRECCLRLPGVATDVRPYWLSRSAQLHHHPDRGTGLGAGSAIKAFLGQAGLGPAPIIEPKESYAW